MVRLPGVRRPAARPAPKLDPSAIRIQRKGHRDLIVRYRQPDFLAQLPRAVAFVAWGAAGLAFMFYENSRPRLQGVDRFFSVYRSSQGAGSRNVALNLTITAFVLCVLGLWANSKRMRRRTDRYNRSLIVLAVLSFAAAIFLWIN